MSDSKNTPDNEKTSGRPPRTNRENEKLVYTKTHRFPVYGKPQNSGVYPKNTVHPAKMVYTKEMTKYP